jgi:uncharacterized protein YqjF (DUF2071 family)
MIPQTNYLISQTWRNLLFLNFRVPRDQIVEVLPNYLTPDEFDGDCYSSIVPFEMTNVKFSFTPSLPFATLNELNLRTYVQYKGKKGIYFFTLDSNHFIANIIARYFFNLPYRYSKIKLELSSNTYKCKSDSINLQAFIGEEKLKGEFENFIAERYFLYTDDSRYIYEGQVNHKPWDLIKIEKIQFDETLNQTYLLKETSFINSFYSSSLDVSFKRFKKVGLI